MENLHAAPGKKMASGVGERSSDASVPAVGGLAAANPNLGQRGIVFAMPGVRGPHGRVTCARAAGADGLRVLEEDDWRLPTETMIAARKALLAAGLPAIKVRVRQNRVALGAGEEVRLSREGRWYRFVKRAGRWEIVAPPADAPDELVDVPGR